MRAGWPSAQYGCSDSQRQAGAVAVGVDALAQVVQFGAGELPVKRSGGLGSFGGEAAFSGEYGLSLTVGALFAGPPG